MSAVSCILKCDSSNVEFGLSSGSDTSLDETTVSPFFVVDISLEECLGTHHCYCYMSTFTVTMPTHMRTHTHTPLVPHTLMFT